VPLPAVAELLELALMLRVGERQPTSEPQLPLSAC
jgi:hypothetical protein